MVSVYRGPDNGAFAHVETYVESRREQLYHLLSYIEQTARGVESPPQLRSNLMNLMQRAQQLGEATAQLLLDAISVGEDFACLYMEGVMLPPANLGAWNGK